MEPVKARKSKSALIVACLVVSLVFAVAFWAFGALHTAPLGTLVRSDLPMLRIDLRFKDAAGEVIPPEKTRLSVEVPEKALPEGCQELEGGDGASPPEQSGDEKPREECPRVATWSVRRHPVAFSLYIRDGARLVAFLEKNAQAREVLDSRFFRGLFRDLLQAGSIRAEDLRLEGLKGAFAERLIRESLKAHAELHYDIRHGNKGFVYSFVRDECPFAAKALPIICRVLVRSGYRAEKLKEPVFEMRVGLQRVFMTEVKGRVYLANGLEGLLNVLESLDPPGKGFPQSPVVLTMRGEAFLDDVIPIMTGEPKWSLDLGIGLPGAKGGELRMSGGTLAKRLTGPVFKGVLASMPRDLFAGVAASLRVSPGFTDEQWKDLAKGSTVDSSAADAVRSGEGGFAVLWDVSGREKRSTALGVAIACPTNPDAVGQFKRYFATATETAECGGGTVFLAATSRDLLTRMRESCAGQSMSVLDWERGAKKPEIESSEVFLFVNPQTALREWFLAGGASGKGGNDEFQPKWKKEVEDAKALMREDSEKVFRVFPVLAYGGKATRDAGSVMLKGFNVWEGTR